MEYISYILIKLRENNVEGTDIMQISGHDNVASINNYLTMSDERHKKISNILSNTETNRNALVPVVSNLPRGDVCTHSVCLHGGLFRKTWN
jgi:hypothetical protein